MSTSTEYLTIIGLVIALIGMTSIAATAFRSRRFWQRTAFRMVDENMQLRLVITRPSDEHSECGKLEVDYTIKEELDGVGDES